MCVCVCVCDVSICISCINWRLTRQLFVLVFNERKAYVLPLSGCVSVCVCVSLFASVCVCVSVLRNPLKYVICMRVRD